MTYPPEITVAQVPHPTPHVCRVGFPLEHPYVEQVWVAVLGPTTTTVLRHLARIVGPDEPVTIPVAELAADLGLWGHDNPRAPLIRHAFERFLRFGLADPDGWPARVGLYSRLPVIPHHRLRRSSERTQATHEQLVNEHLAELAASYPRQPAAARSDVAHIVERLDRLEAGTAPTELGPTLSAP